MRRVFYFFGTLYAASILTMAFRGINQEREAMLKLNRNEMEALYQIIDDAAVAGQIRKPLLQKIATTYEATWPSRPAPTPKADTTKPKKN